MRLVSGDADASSSDIVSYRGSFCVLIGVKMVYVVYSIQMDNTKQEGYKVLVEHTFEADDKTRAVEQFFKLHPEEEEISDTILIIESFSVK
jgi:hypothetical protein